MQRAALAHQAALSLQDNCQPLNASASYTFGLAHHATPTIRSEMMTDEYAVRSIMCVGTALPADRRTAPALYMQFGTVGR